MGFPGPDACHYCALHPVCHSCTIPLPVPNCNRLTHLSQIPMCFGHEVRRWRRRGEWECNSWFGRAGELQSKKIDESSRRPWEGLLRVETGSIYIPTLCLPGHFWLCILPYLAEVPSVWNVLVIWNIYTVHLDSDYKIHLTPTLIIPAPMCHFVFTSALMCAFKCLIPSRL